MQKRWRGLAFGIFVGFAGACNTADLTKASDPGAGTSGGSADPGADPDPAAAEAGADPVAHLDGGVIPVSSNVTIQVQPSDFGAAIEAAIRAAKTACT